MIDVVENDKNIYLGIEANQKFCCVANAVHVTIPIRPRRFIG